ncbi:9400_t:CDS:1, partial [Ambispora gerdemannii]
ELISFALDANKASTTSSRNILDEEWSESGHNTECMETLQSRMSKTISSSYPSPIP